MKISNNFSFGKVLLDFERRWKLKSLCIMLPKMSSDAKSFDEK